jgi:hypothetical protein
MECKIVDEDAKPSQVGGQARLGLSHALFFILVNWVVTGLGVKECC